MLAKQHFSTKQAREFGDKFGIDWDWSCSSDDQLLSLPAIHCVQNLTKNGCSLPKKPARRGVFIKNLQSYRGTQEFFEDAGQLMGEGEFFVS